MEVINRITNFKISSSFYFEKLEIMRAQFQKEKR